MNNATQRFALTAMNVFVLSILVIAVAHAQTSTDTDNTESASLSIVETVPIVAQLEVTHDGQVYKLAIPATLNIDTQAVLADALFATQVPNKVGMLQWKIQSIDEHTKAVELSRFTSVDAPTPGHKIVVVHSEITNLGNMPFERHTIIREFLAYDEMGNLYEAGTWNIDCSDLNPGNTGPCVAAFVVPEHVTILGLDLQVTDHKRMPYTPEE